MMRNAMLAGVALVLLTAFTGCGVKSDTKTLKLAHALDMDHPVHKAMVFMAEKVAEKTQGSVTVEVYPNGQLGAERELIEQVQMGSIDITKTSTSPLESFVPIMGVFSVPYVFRDEDHLWAVLNGEIGERLLGAGENVGFKGLCYYDAGSRSFYTKDRPVHSPADLKGLKIRVQKSKTSMQMVEALGASPTPISWGELYTSLQQGVVDGAENNSPSFHTSRHYEVCKYYTLDEHTAVPDILIMSQVVWDSLSPEVQQALMEAAAESSAYQRELWQEKTEESLRVIQEAGVEIIRPDKEPFRQAVEAMKASYDGTEIGVVISEIEAVK